MTDLRVPEEHESEYAAAGGGHAKDLAADADACSAPEFEDFKSACDALGLATNSKAAREIKAAFSAGRPTYRYEVINPMSGARYTIGASEDDAIYGDIPSVAAPVGHQWTSRVVVQPTLMDAVRHGGVYIGGLGGWVAGQWRALKTAAGEPVISESTTFIFAGASSQRELRDFVAWLSSENVTCSYSASAHQTAEGDCSLVPPWEMLAGAVLSGPSSLILDSTACTISAPPSGESGKSHLVANWVIDSIDAFDTVDERGNLVIGEGYYTLTLSRVSPNTGARIHATAAKLPTRLLSQPELWRDHLPTDWAAPMYTDRQRAGEIVAEQVNRLGCAAKKCRKSTGWTPYGDGEWAYAFGPGAVTRHGYTDVVRTVDLPGQNSISWGMWAEPILDPASELAQLWAEIGKLRDGVVAAILGAVAASTIPQAGGATVTFAGPTDGGKTYCAWLTQSFFGHIPKIGAAPFTLDGSSLPGFYATVRPLHHCVIALDDQAPTGDARVDARGQAEVDGLKRATFNRSSRMKSTPTGESRVESPIEAMLVTTAEVTGGVASASNRDLRVNVVRGSEDGLISTLRNPGDDISTLDAWVAEHRGPQRITTIWLAWAAEKMNDIEEHWPALRRETAERIRARLGVSSNRQVGILADFAVALELFEQMADEMGSPCPWPLHEWIVDVFAPHAAQTADRWHGNIGRTLMRIAHAINSGAVHVATADGSPPSPVALGLPPATLTTSPEYSKRLYQIGWKHNYWVGSDGMRRSGSVEARSARSIGRLHDEGAGVSISTGALAGMPEIGELAAMELVQGLRPWLEQYKYPVTAGRTVNTGPGTQRRAALIPLQVLSDALGDADDTEPEQAPGETTVEGL